MTAPVPILVRLSEADQALVWEITRKRQDPKHKRGVASKKCYKGRGEYETTALGVGAEVAVARELGIDPDTTAGFGGDKGRPDLYYQGWGIEGRNHGENGAGKAGLWDFALMCDGPYALQADVGVLVYHMREWEYEIQGVISRQTFCRVYTVRDYGYGARETAGHEHFRDFELLRNIWEKGKGGDEDTETSYTGTEEGAG